MAQYVTKTQDRLDRICFEYYGSTARGEVEFVLKSNPGLDEQPIVLPAGLLIDLPDRPVAPVQTRVVKQVFLWD